MRILHTVGDLKLSREFEREGASGVVRVALELARAQVQLGHEVWVAAIGPVEWKANWHGVRLISLKPTTWAQVRIGNRSLNFGLHFPYIILTRKYKFDIIHGQHYNYLRFLRAKARVAHFHCDPFYKGSIAVENLAMSQADFLRIARSTNSQVAVSRFIAEELQHGLGNLGDIHLVYNGVDAEQFKPEQWQEARDSLRERWGVKTGEVVFLYAGAIAPEKGVLHLARAFAKLSQHVHNIHLVLAGSSNMWGRSLATNDPRYLYDIEVRSILDSVHSKDRVHFLGKVGLLEMPGVYAASDVVVIPSVWKEPFPLVALEALAAGRPVIASATGGLPEIVNEANGLLVKPGDEDGLEAAMCTLLHDPLRRRQLGISGQETTQRFSWRNAAAEIEAIYDDILRKR